MNDKKNRQKKPQVVLSAEDLVAQQAAREKAQAEQKAERERIDLYGKATNKMSHRQLRSELVKTIRREYAGKPPEPQAGLTIAFATILLTVLDNTKTGETRLRDDQKNPFGKLSAYPL